MQIKFYSYVAIDGKCISDAPIPLLLADLILIYLILKLVDSDTLLYGHNLHSCKLYHMTTNCTASAPVFNSLSIQFVV